MDKIAQLKQRLSRGCTLIRKPILSICLTLFVTAGSALQITNDACCKGYDTISGEIRQSPFKDGHCRTSVVKQPLTRKIGIVKNYRRLFTWIGIPFDKSFFQHTLVRKLLENHNINPYTVTIALIEQKDLFDTACQGTVAVKHELDRNNFYQRYGDAFISHIMTGGRDIILYHIATPSEESKKRLLREFKQKPLSKKIFEKKLMHLKEKYTIIPKEYFSDFLDGIPAADLNESLHHTTYFEKIADTSAKPYRYVITRNHRQPDENVTGEKRQFTKEIETILDQVYAFNAYHFYRHHQQDFYPLKPQICRTLNRLSQQIENRLSRLYNAREINITDLHRSEDKDIIALLPKRYQTPLPKSQKLHIPAQHITFELDDFSDIIAPETMLHFQLNTIIDKQNHGKMLRITHTIHIQIGDRTYKKSHKQILYDTYVDFPGLRFASLSQNYGSCTKDTAFDKYEKSFSFQCRGLIEKASCQYRLDTDGRLSLTCNIEKIKSPRIKYLHEEEIAE